MKIYTNEYTQKVFDILEPLAGKSMAQAILKVQCAAIGCTEETLQLKDMPELAERIKKGLVVFLGSEKAQAVALKVSKIV